MQPPPRLFNISILLSTALLSDWAYADCHWNWDETFYGCDLIGIRNGVGMSLPRIRDVLQVNPASIPSIPTPIGVEAVYNSRTEGSGTKKLDASIIRGFKGFGIGLATWNADSFSDPDLGRAFGSANYKSIYQTLLQNSISRPGFQFGSSLAIPNPLPMLGHFSLGGSLGQNPFSSLIARNIGGNWVWRFLNAGYSYSVQKISLDLPQVETLTASLGLQVEELSLNYSYIETHGGTPQPATSVYSLRYTDDSWSIYGAMKTFMNDLGNTNIWATGSIHKNLGEHLAFGYLYGQYPHSHSFSAQFYF